MGVQFTWIDWTIVVAFLLASLAIGLYYTGRASTSIDEYFLSGRSLPWWLAGTSMVATSFATDSPLITSSLVRKYGIAGSWYWLSFGMADVLCLVLFSKLWRRANIMTDAEITEVRYSGKSATVLRVFSALYAAIPINCIIMGWVTLAMIKILGFTVGWPKEIVIPSLLVLMATYTILSGMWGAVTTDLFQFIFKMIGCTVMAFVAVAQCGGLEAMKQKLLAVKPTVFHFMPTFGPGEMTVFAFVVYLGVQWWAQRGVGGGGQITQRMFSCKDEKNSTLSVFFFVIAHYAIRVWPWIVVGLATILLYPNEVDQEAAYPKFIAQYLPNGLYGLMIASMFAAYMSTIVTHLNWGSSYLIVDFYKRLIKKDASEAHYVLASRVAVVFLLAAASIVAYNMKTIEGAWKFLFAFSAGVGPVYALRWYWWRINAWSEITALAASAVYTTILTNISFGANYSWIHGDDDQYCIRLLATLALTTVTWLIVTYLTPPDDEETLKSFYVRVRPAGPGWGPVRAALIRDTGKAPEIKEKVPTEMLGFALGVVMVYGSYIALGKIILAFWSDAAIWTTLSVGSGIWLYKLIVSDPYRVSEDDKPSQEDRPQPVSAAAPEYVGTRD